MMTIKTKISYRNNLHRISILLTELIEDAQLTPTEKQSVVNLRRIINKVNQKGHSISLMKGAFSHYQKELSPLFYLKVYKIISANYQLRYAGDLVEALSKIDSLN